MCVCDLDRKQKNGNAVKNESRSGSESGSESSSSESSSESGSELDSNSDSGTDQKKNTKSKPVQSKPVTKVINKCKYDVLLRVKCMCVTSGIHVLTLMFVCVFSRLRRRKCLSLIWMTVSLFLYHFCVLMS